MFEFEPELFNPEPLPENTLENLKEESPEYYDVLMAILETFSKNIYKQGTPHLGLEGTMEGVIDLYSKGWFKIYWSEEEDTFNLRTFNAMTGEYI
jgi:hypothetical protein